MTNCEDVKYCVIELLSKNKIDVYPKDRTKIIKILSDYVNMLIFNIVAVTCIICLQIGVKRLLKEHVEHLQGYIHKRCGLSKIYKPQQMRGGTFNTATFYGIHEPQYSTQNVGSDVMNIDWKNNIARPMLASTMTGGRLGASGRHGRKNCDKVHKMVAKEIYKVFQFFKVTASKAVREDFVNIFDKYMTELIQLLAISKTTLTADKLQRLLKKSKIMQKK